MLGNSIFRIETSKQPLVGKSSTECELVACNKIVEELIWAKGLMEEFGYHQKEMEIGQDNKSTILIANRGPGRGGRTKHINVRYYFISQFIDSGDIKLVYVPSKELMSDGLTKPIPRQEFLDWRRKLLKVEE